MANSKGFDDKKLDLLTGGPSTAASKTVVDFSLLERDLLSEQNFIVVHGSNDKKVKVQVQTGQVNECTLRRAFQLEKELPVALWKDDLFLQVRPEGDDFIYDLGGNWKGQTYKLEWEEEPRFRPSTAIVSCVGSSAEARPVSPDPKASSTPPPTPETINKWMYYGVESTEKSTVVCIHPRYFVTFQNGPHHQLQVGNSMRIFPAKTETNEGVGNEGYEVTVANIEEKRGFIILRSEEAIGPKSPRLVPAKESESFLMAGFGGMSTGTQQLVYSTGIVHNAEYYFRPNDESCSLGPVILGTVQGSRNNSVGACWSADGFIGVSCGVTVPKRTHSSAISGPKNYISPATEIKMALWRALGLDKAKAFEKEGKVWHGGIIDVYNEP